MTINKIFETLRDRQMVGSLRQFSQEFLCRAANYAADTNLNCSPAVLLNLYRKLGEIGQTDLQAVAFQHLLDVEAQERHDRAVQP